MPRQMRDVVGTCPIEQANGPDQVLVESLDYMEDYDSDEYISDDDAIME